MKPIIQHEPPGANCYFFVGPGRTPADVAIPSMGPAQYEEGGETHVGIYVATFYSGRWGAVAFRPRDTYDGLSVDCPSVPAEKIAWPVDPSMERIDIDGATHVELNAAGTAWVFRHGSAAAHQRHLLDVRSGVLDLFQPLIDAVDLKWRQAIGVRGNTADNRLVKLANLLEYRDAVLAAALKAEKQHHHGHFLQQPHPEVDHVHAAIQAALKATKLAWGTTAAAKYQTIVTEAGAAAKAMADPHAPETRAAKAARIAAAKKAAAEAETETETPDDPQGD